MRPLLLLLCLVARASAAPPEPSIDVVAAPPIETAPAGGLDPDVVARLDAVDQAIGTSPLDALVDRVLVLYESDDPFSRAQREAARPRSVELLGRIGERARTAGDLVTAARAFDARRTISGGGRDPQLAQVLTAWAERDAKASPGRALYLARRARAADPGDSRAADLDDDLGKNHRVWPGRLAIVAGFVALAVGIYARSRVSAIEEDLAMHARPGDQVESALAERDRYDAIGTGLIIAAPVISFGGVLLMWSGKPSYSPTSPAELPALGGR